MTREDVLLTAPSLWNLIEARAAETPDALMLVDSRDRTLTFVEYRTAAERAAAGFAARGLTSGSTVAWQLPTWIETVVLMGALARLGARQVPLLPAFRERELEACLHDTGAELVCVPGTWRGTDHRALVTEVVARLERSPSILVCDPVLPDGDPATLPPTPSDERAGTAPTWVFVTSGTTACPKGALHSDRSVMTSAAGFCRAQGLRPTDRLGLAFPFTHIGGLNNLCAALEAGFALILVDAFDPPEAAATFRRHGATLIGGGPVFYAAFLAEQRHQPDRSILPSLRFMTGGGAPMAPELHRLVRAEIGGRGCAHGYGMTEACIVAMNDPCDSDVHLEQTVGRPVDGVQVRIVTSNGTEAGPGTLGEVRIRGPLVFHGYIDPALDAGAFDPEGWFRTGDLGEIDGNGYLRISGRTKDVIIRKGENVSAPEVEAHLRQHPRIADVAVIGLPDPERGELVCAVVVPTDSADPPILDDVREHFTLEGIMTQKVPERLETVDELPRNATGKVRKDLLRDQFTTDANQAVGRRSIGS